MMQEVWTIAESRVYHLTNDCDALKRSNRYHVPRKVPLSEATGNHPYRGRRRPCALCASERTTFTQTNTREGVSMGTSNAQSSDAEAKEQEAPATPEQAPEQAETPAEEAAPEE